MSKFCISKNAAALCLAVAFGAVSAKATSVSYDFGSDTGMSTSGASNSTTGVSLTTPFTLNKTFANSIVITTSAGGLFCAVGVTANTCGNSTGLSTSNAYGLGVGDGRIDVGDTLTFTAQPGFLVKLTSFAVTGFSGSEQVLYSVNGGSATVINAPVTNVALDSFSGGGVAFQTLAFGAGNAGNYSLAQITFDVTAVPEPATYVLVGGAMMVFSFLRRRRA